MAVLEAVALTRRFGDRDVLCGVDLGLMPGHMTVISGRSGSGKSTLMSILAGLTPPTGGHVSIDGTRLDKLDAEALSRHRLRTIGMVFQNFRLIPDLTALENVALPLTLAGRRASTAYPRAKELLSIVGLLDQRHAFPDTLSGGEQQRVAIARALANDPPIVLADEPTANLDEQNARTTMQTLADLARQGRAVLVASHDPISLPYATEAYEVTEGRLSPVPLGHQGTSPPNSAAPKRRNPLRRRAPT